MILTTRVPDVHQTMSGEIGDVCTILTLCAACSPPIYSLAKHTISPVGDGFELLFDIFDPSTAEVRDGLPT